VVLPTALNDSSSDLGDSVDALERNIDAEERNQNKLQQVRVQAAEKATHLREQAAEKAPQVRAQAVEKAQQIRVRAAEKAPQMVRANRGKAVGAFPAFRSWWWILGHTWTVWAGQRLAPSVPPCEGLVHESPRSG
jgi:cell division septum initiation protein DivIVA